MPAIKDMNKTELIELVNNLQQLNDSQVQRLDNLYHQVLELQLKLEASSGNGRKSQVLELLRNNKTISIMNIANSLGISTKNVSSQLTYLRSDGYQIFTDPNGKKMLVEDTKDEDDSIDKEESIDEDVIEE